MVGGRGGQVGGGTARGGGVDDTDQVKDGDQAKDAAAPVVRVAGLPGAFLTWGQAVVGAVLAAGGRAGAVLGDSGPGMLEGLKAGQAAVLFVDAPQHALADLVTAGVETVEAVRGMTAVLARLAVLARRDGALVIGRGDAPGEMVKVLAERLLGGAVDGVVVPALSEAPGALPPATAKLAELVLQPMLASLRGEAAQIVWPRVCFYDGDRPGEVAPEVIDVVGPARVLAYGPYFHLPPGRWRARAVLSFSEAACRNQYALDVFTGEQLARGSLRPEQAGAYAAAIGFRHEAVEQRIEFRLWLVRGAIEGVAAIAQVELEEVLP